MKTRALTALAIILVVLFPVTYGGIPLEILGIFVVVTGCYEWLHISPDYEDWKYIILPFTIAAVFLCRFVDPRYLYIVVAAAALFYWMVPVADEKFTIQDGQNSFFCFGIFALAYLAVGRLIPQHEYLWTICFATYGSDTFAYLVGRFFGKHKMNPRISPKKTWEGFAGGVIGGFMLSWVFSTMYWNTLDPKLNFFLCLLCPIVAEAGDMCFSSIKRFYNTKDFSNLLPGHGGILDRTDSLLANLILFGMLYQIFL